MRFNHRPKVLTPEDQRLGSCSVCGSPVEGMAGDLRHKGEIVPVLTPAAPGDVVILQSAEQVAASALDKLTWTPGASNRDRARAVVDALHQAGLLTAKRPRRSA